ncbi:MAG: hypothetical protein ACOYL3_17260 [Desulfuromonadaceae bacterium]
MTPCSRINRFTALVLIITLGLVPTAFAVTAPVVSTLTSITDGVRTPVRLALSQWGDIFVTDPRGGGLNKYNNAGLLQKSIPMAVTPKGVAVAANGDILVSQGTAVTVLDPASGTVKSSFGTFKMANGIAVDSTGIIYIVDSLDNSVQVYSATYSKLSSFGTAGNTNGLFFQPTGITFEKLSRQLAVVDTLNGRVQFFTTAGVWVKTVGAFGAGPLKFTSPQSIAFEYSSDGLRLDRMYVVDTFQGNVQVLDASNSATPGFLRYVGNYGMKSGNLVVPSDLLFDSSDSANSRLIVANGSGRLALFGITGGNSVPAGSTGSGGTTVSIPTVNTPSGPTLTIDSYASYTNVTSLILSGTVSSGTVTVNGISVPVNNKIWTSAPITLKTGSNVIPVVATGAGSTSITSRSITINVIAQITALAPVVLSVNRYTSPTGNKDLVLAGTIEKCADGISATAAVTVDGAPAAISGTTWSLPAVTLKSGSSSFLIKGTTEGCSESITSFNITLDNTRPLLTVYALSDGSITSTPVQTISGTATDASATSVSIKVNGVEQAKAPVNDGAYSLPVTLALGINTVNVTVTDAVGNISIPDQRILTYEPQATPVAVNISSGAVIAPPLPAETGSTPAPQFTFTTSAPAGFKPVIWINGTLIPEEDIVRADSIVTPVAKAAAKSTIAKSVAAAVEPAGDVAWVVLVKTALVAGLNTIEIKAAAPDPKDVTKTIFTETVAVTVNFSSELPAIAVTTPSKDITTANKTYTLVGTATPGVSVTALVNGIATRVNLAASGAFSLAIDFPGAGSYAATLSATDSNGNTSNSYRTIVYDPRVPSIAYDKITRKYTASSGILYAKDRDGNFVTCGISNSSKSTLDVTPCDSLKLNVFALSGGGNNSRDGDIACVVNPDGTCTKNSDGTNKRKGYVDITDAMMALKFSLDISTYSDEDLLYGDIATVNGKPILDDKIRLDDVTSILYKAIGLNQ